jgi:hypothetical protein
MLALCLQRRWETLILLSYGAVQHPIGVQRYFSQKDFCSEVDRRSPRPV